MNKSVNGLYRYVKWHMLIDYIINVILTPSTWSLLRKPTKKATTILDMLLEKYHSGEYSADGGLYHIKFTGDDVEFKVWISNYPYSYGYVYDFGGPGGSIIKYDQPSRYSVVLFRRFEEELRTNKYFDTPEPSMAALLAKIGRPNDRV